MAHGDPRYIRVNELWASLANRMRPLDAEEALKIAKLICNKFGLKSLGGPNMHRKFVVKKVRRCWLDKKGGTIIHKGWPRLAHDISHMINRARHPSFAPHDDTQAILEWEISCFVKDYLTN